MRPEEHWRVTTVSLLQAGLHPVPPEGFHLFWASTLRTAWRVQEKGNNLGKNLSHVDLFEDVKMPGLRGRNLRYSPIF